MVAVHRCIAMRWIGIESRGLVAPVKFVEPNILEEIVVNGGNCCGLIQATEFGISGSSGSEIEEVLERVRCVVNWEKGIVRHRRWQALRL